MRNLKDMNLDIALLPMGGTYTMNVEEAIDAANTIAAKTTIPMCITKCFSETRRREPKRS